MGIYMSKCICMSAHTHTHTHIYIYKYIYIYIYIHICLPSDIRAVFNLSIPKASSSLALL